MLKVNFIVSKFKHIYFTSIEEKQVLTTYTNLSRFCFLGTTPVLAPNVWANDKIPKLTPAPGNRTQDLKIDFEKKSWNISKGKVAILG